VTDAHKLNEAAFAGETEEDPFTDEAVLEAVVKARQHIDVAFAVIIEMVGAGDWRMAATAGMDLMAAGGATAELMRHVAIHKLVDPGSMEEALRGYVDLAHRHHPGLFEPEMVTDMLEEAHRHDMLTEAAREAAEKVAAWMREADESDGAPGPTEL
jgi:hypothetical protein